MILSHEEWNNINKTVMLLWSTVDEKALRENILYSIKDLIPFNLGGFCHYTYSDNSKESVIENYVMIGDPSKESIEEHKYMYDNIYGKYDYTKWLLGNKESIVCRESDIISDKIREKTSFYKDFLKPRGLLYCLDCYIINEAIKPSLLFFYRDAVSGDFSDREVYILSKLMPHIEGRFVLTSSYSDTPPICKFQDAFTLHLSVNYLSNVPFSSFRNVTSGTYRGMIFTVYYL